MFQCRDWDDPINAVCSGDRNACYLSAGIKHWTTTVTLAKRRGDIEATDTGYHFSATYLTVLDGQLAAWAKAWIVYIAPI